MKAYQKAEMIAKNLPTGSYAAGCPTHGGKNGFGYYGPEPPKNSPYGWDSYSSHSSICQPCEVRA
jgi:hypothetical protein